MDKFNLLLNLGFSAFPVDKGSKRPLVPWTKFQSALPLEREVFWWGRRFPGCNVGVATGAVSNIVVLDIDSREGYEEAKRRGLPPTPSVITGKGIHYYFLHPGYEVRNFARKLPGIDLRGDGGYVVAPGSTHAETGNPYEWRVHPMDSPFAQMPRWLLQLIEKKDEAADPQTIDKVTKMLNQTISTAKDVSKYGNKAFSEEIAYLMDAKSGSRNNTLFKVSVRMFELAKAGELQVAPVTETLERIALQIGLKPSEIQTTMNSAERSAQPKPRPVLL